MNYHAHYAGIPGRIEACVVGGGAFGRSFLAQAGRIPRLLARVVVDVTAEAAGEALAAAGMPRRDIRLCRTTAEARAAWDQGHGIAAGAFELVQPLPFDIMIEATGHPEAAARHALGAIDARRHILMVTKETDSVAGPMLARLAETAGVGMTPVDGDQPSLLIGLTSWAEVLGFDIVAAGKSSEYDFVFDAATSAVTSNGVRASLPQLGALWHPGTRALSAVAAERAAILGAAFPLSAVPDLCELTVVANATGLVPDVPALHAPPARIGELASLLSTGPEHGVMAGTRRLDVFHHLRAPDEASFAGGVFVVVGCQDQASWQVLAGKGHPVSADGKTALIYQPRHLLGLEAATSVFDLVGLGRSGYGAAYLPRIDLVAVATRDLPAGTRLAAEGHHHTIAGVGAEMRPMSPVARDESAPYYLVANRLLARARKAGEAIRLSDLEIEPGSVLLDLRLRQDRTFA